MKSRLPLNFLPIVIRELMVAARRPSTYRGRFWTVSAGLFISFAIAMFSGGGGGTNSQGPVMFTALAVLGFGYCLIGGLRVTADCLSVEKRDGTLGLLFLTDLRSLDVVFGKLAATSLSSVYGLVALIPILAVPLQLGGVTGLTFLQVVLCWMNALFLSLAAGILVSAKSYHDRKAMTAALLLVAGIAVGPYILLFYVESMEDPSLYWLRGLAWPFLLVSPLSPFLIANAATFGVGGPGMTLQYSTWTPGEVFGVALVSSHVFSWGLLLWASYSLVGFVRHRARVSWIERCRDRVQQFLYGNAAARAAHRRQLLEMNAFSWLTSRERFKSRYVWVFLVSLVVIYFWNLYRQGDVMFDMKTLLPLGLFVHAFLKVWVASEACYRIAEDRRIGALELLLSTPLGPWDIVRGQFLVLWRQFAMPLLTLFFLELVLVFTVATELRDTNEFQVRAMYLGGAFMLLVDCALIGWVAMWNAVDQGSINRAIAKTIFQFLIVPWGIYAVGVVVIDGGREFIAASGYFVLDLTWLGSDKWRFEVDWPRLTTQGKVWFWVGVGLWYNWRVSIRSARHQLLERFRERVAGGLPKTT